MAAAQRPLSGLAFSSLQEFRRGRSCHPGRWSTGDKVVGTDAVRSMAERAGATITEVEGST